MTDLDGGGIEIAEPEDENEEQGDSDNIYQPKVGKL